MTVGAPSWLKSPSGGRLNSGEATGHCWLDASVTDESLTGLREGDSPEVVPVVAVWSGEGWLPRTDVGVTNELPSGTGRPGQRSSWEAARASGSKLSLVFLYRRVETGRPSW